MDVMDFPFPFQFPDLNPSKDLWDQLGRQKEVKKHCVKVLIVAELLFILWQIELKLL